MRLAHWSSLIGGMQEASESGSNLNLILDDLGVTEIRKTDTLKRLTSAAGLMATTMDTATNAWQQNTALTNEAAQRYSTTESKLLMLKNQVNEAAISVGNGFKGALAASIDVLGPFLDAVISIAHGFENADSSRPVGGDEHAWTHGVHRAAPHRGRQAHVACGQHRHRPGKGLKRFGGESRRRTTADTVATEANAKAQTAQIAKQAVKDAMDARAAIRAASKAAATAADTVATTANTAATGANAAAMGTATIKTVALSVRWPKRKLPHAAIATVAQLAWKRRDGREPCGCGCCCGNCLGNRHRGCGRCHFVCGWQARPVDRSERSGNKRKSTSCGLHTMKRSIHRASIRMRPCRQNMRLTRKRRALRRRRKRWSSSRTAAKRPSMPMRS